MPYAVTLRLDDGAAARVEQLWRALADIGGDGAFGREYAPHISLALLPDTVCAEAIEGAVFGVVHAWEALPIVLAALGVFPGAHPVIWAAPVVTGRLLACHDALNAALTAFPVHPHYRPGSWVPHVTLSQHGRLPAGRAVEIAASAWDGPISGRLDRIDLVRFGPVDVLRSEHLKHSGSSG